MGTRQYLVPVVQVNRRPTSGDIKDPKTGHYYPVPTFWSVSKDPTTGLQGELWLLSKIVSNQSVWIPVTAGANSANLTAGGAQIMSGTGDPNTTVTAPKGSMYLRLDGSSSSTRAYVNSDGATAWIAITTAS